MRSFHTKSVVAGLLFTCATLPLSAIAETVFVKYQGNVDLVPFHCETIARSSFINRLCYDQNEEYVIVKLNATYYHYCEVPAGMVDEWRKAVSMGSYYNVHVKRRFDCRINRVPSYE